MKFSMNDSLAAVEMCKKWKLGLNASFLKKVGQRRRKRAKCFAKCSEKSFIRFLPMADEAVAIFE